MTPTWSWSTWDGTSPRNLAGVAPKFLVYGLIDPRDGQLRYVGKSTSGLARPRQHVQPAFLKRDRRHKGNWVRSLVALGMRPEVEVLEVHESAETLAEAECFYIAYFRSLGCRLTNLTDGGEGQVGWTPTVETRAKIAMAHRGTPMSEKTKRSIAAALTGRPCPANGLRVADENGTVYESLCDAARRLGLRSDVLSRRLKRGQSYRGHVFRYLET